MDKDRILYLHISISLPINSLHMPMQIVRTRNGSGSPPAESPECYLHLNLRLLQQLDSCAERNGE